MDLNNNLCFADYYPNGNSWNTHPVLNINYLNRYYSGRNRIPQIGFSNKMIMFGGMVFGTGYVTDISELNLDNGDWRNIGFLPELITGSCAIVDGNTAYIMGDDDNDVFYSFNLETYTLEVKPDLPRAGIPLSAVVHEGYLYIFGFYCPNWTGYERECYRFNLSTETWEQIHDLPSAKKCRGCPAVVCNGKIFVY